MNILAEISGIKYTPISIKMLDEIQIDELNINTMPSSCIINDKSSSFSVSKWVSPKRTRSYPYERIYNTLSNRKRITVIPIIKDEGSRGDRDFIQWDTISLMSLLDVYVILAYYNNAEKHPSRENKITKQKFDNDYVKDKIFGISNYHSSALHWNLKEIKDTLPNLIGLVKESLQKISEELDVIFHAVEGINRFKKQFENDVEEFMKTSREKAKKAQYREIHTVQPKEALSTLTKATITIRNYLGGLYYFTTDEIDIKDNDIYLIESKHSKYNKLPSIGDIKDGLLKMILYCNLEDVQVDNKTYNSFPVLKLTSSKLEGCISTDSSQFEITEFIKLNDFKEKEKMIIKKLFEEGRTNKFLCTIETGSI